MNNQRKKCHFFLGWELLKDPIGRDHFLTFLEREYATGTNVLYMFQKCRYVELSLCGCCCSTTNNKSLVPLISFLYAPHPYTGAMINDKRAI